MKKLLIAFAVLFSTCMFSCGNSEVSTNDSTAVDSILVDTVAADSIL